MTRLAAAAAAGITTVPEFVDIEHAQRLDDAESWWEIVMGSGLRGLVDELTDAERADLKTVCEQMIAKHTVAQIQPDALMTVITKG